LSFRTVPTAITLVRWVNENAFVFKAQTRPCPTFGRPVHLGFPHRLRPGTSPHALQIPPHGGHPALRRTTSGGSRSVFAVSSFRLRVRLDFSIPSAFFGQRGATPAFGYGAPHLGARGTRTLLDIASLSTRFAYSALACFRMGISGPRRVSRRVTRTVTAANLCVSAVRCNAGRSDTGQVRGLF
jgi:hypothetical protein